MVFSYAKNLKYVKPRLGVSTLTWIVLDTPKTRNRMRVAIESGKGMKVKVLK